MKTFKKILAVALAVLCMASCVCISVSADTEVVDTKIYFEVPEFWGDYTTVYCHIWVYEGDELATWQSKKEACVATDTENLYSYDTTKVGGLQEDTLYGVIFSVKEGSQTYDTFMGYQCLGDTLYCVENPFENPEDSSKSACGAFWKNQDETKFGPVKQITSIGNVVGTAIPEGKTNVDLFIDFIENGRFENAVKVTGISAEDIALGVIVGLEMTEEELLELLEILNPATEDEATPDEDATIDEVVMLGDAYKDGVVNIKDATFIQKVIAGLEQFQSEFDSKAADVNYDGTINIKDATVIQKHIAGLDTGFEDIGKYI